jgi:hypothetical protein
MAGSSLQCLWRTSLKTIGDVVIIDDPINRTVCSVTTFVDPTEREARRRDMAEIPHIFGGAYAIGGRPSRASNSVWSAMAHRLPAFHRLTAFLEGTP